MHPASTVLITLFGLKDVFAISRGRLAPKRCYKAADKAIALAKTPLSTWSSLPKLHRMGNTSQAIARTPN
ncbi:MULTISPECIES: hypothetical protein [Nostocales]|uniref:Uncharacterized protein n=3 Tax=Nostocales TaxID=1161 RepID=A0A8S9T801_9CYAN|nr:hypothetical protein [Tolypothrix bouteillei]KAF3888127.1 hypothetical protein DA73_0400023505 [Tolypothrix bouteillei VB521301]